MNNNKSVLRNVDHYVEDDGKGLSLEGRTACNNRQYAEKAKMELYSCQNKVRLARFGSGGRFQLWSHTQVQPGSASSQSASHFGTPWGLWVIIYHSYSQTVCGIFVEIGAQANNRILVCNRTLVELYVAGICYQVSRFI